jgi:hypothetical protein
MPRIAAEKIATGPAGERRGMSLAVVANAFAGCHELPDAVVDSSCGPVEERGAASADRLAGPLEIGARERVDLLDREPERARGQITAWSTRA